MTSALKHPTLTISSLRMQQLAEEEEEEEEEKSLTLGTQGVEESKRQESRSKRHQDNPEDQRPGS